MILDNHIHLWGADPQMDTLASRLAEAGIAGGVLISPPPTPYLVQKAAPLLPTQRLHNVLTWTQGRDIWFPFYWIDPTEPDALAPRPGLYRIRESAGRWEALPQRDGSTLIRLESHTNPGSHLPGWLVNPMAIKAALGSFQAIRRLMEAQPRAAPRQRLLGGGGCPAAS